MKKVCPKCKLELDVDHTYSFSYYYNCANCDISFSYLFNGQFTELKTFKYKIYGGGSVLNSKYDKIYDYKDLITDHIQAYKILDNLIFI